MEYEFDPYFDMEPDPEVVENPAFVVELNRRFEEASLQLYGPTFPLVEYNNEKLYC